MLVLAIDVLSGGYVRKHVRAGASVVSLWGNGFGSTVLNSGIFSSRRMLVDQNRSLSEKLAQLEEGAQSSEALKRENEELRALMNIAHGTTSTGVVSGITAPIVSSVRSSPYGTFLIGAGSVDGIATGSYVITAGGVVVGLVGDIGARTSIVTEIFAPWLSEEGVINGAVVVVKGSGGGNAYAKVPRGLLVRVGDPVISPRFGSRTIGFVGKVSSSAASPVQDVYIRIPVNFSSQRYVYIIPASN